MCVGVCTMIVVVVVVVVVVGAGTVVGLRTNMMAPVRSSSSRWGLVLIKNSFNDTSHSTASLRKASISSSSLGETYTSARSRMVSWSRFSFSVIEDIVYTYVYSFSLVLGVSFSVHKSTRTKRGHGRGNCTKNKNNWFLCLKQYAIVLLYVLCRLRQ